MLWDSGFSCWDRVSSVELLSEHSRRWMRGSQTHWKQLKWLCVLQTSFIRVLIHRLCLIACSCAAGGLLMATNIIDYHWWSIDWWWSPNSSFDVTFASRSLRSISPHVVNASAENVFCDKFGEGWTPTGHESLTPAENVKREDERAPKHRSGSIQIRSRQHSS